jgi:thiol:disulfide interchange protein DsbD
MAASALPVPLATFRAESPGFRGDSATVRVRVAIPNGWHIQSNAPLDDFLIPTEVKASGEGLAFGTPVFPKAKMKDLEALGGKVALFEDSLSVRVPVRARRGTDAEKSLAASVVSVRYQACNDSQCLPPKVITAKYEK